jgi:23S rRNA (cytosine1962-C5)-methyltransferase
VHGGILHEDEHLLVVNKPAGWNTHAPSPYAGEGIYDWLRHREPRWADLGVVHRLDKETSGVLVFGKSRAATRSLAQQFEQREVEKVYRLLTDRAVRFDSRILRCAVVRAGERYVARPVHAGAAAAETEFRDVGRRSGLVEVEARPRSGVTHQIRVQAAWDGWPILGDALYGGTCAVAGAGSRLALHAASLRLRHPVTGQTLRFDAPLLDWGRDTQALRRAVIDPGETDAFRVAHGAADGVPGVYADRYGAVVLVQAEAMDQVAARAGCFLEWAGVGTLYGQRLERRLRGRTVQDLAPQCLQGPAPDGPQVVRENGVKFLIRLDAGYSVGLFLDQRDNRRRLLTNHVAAHFPVRAGGLKGAAVLNTFAYTCGFSVVATLAGARTANVDLSRRSLDWGRENLALNGLDPTGQEFLQGDVFEWLRRLGRKTRRFDLVILDPPTFSRSKERGVFRAEKDYDALVSCALPLVAEGGVLLASTNAAELRPEAFVARVREAVVRGGRRLERDHYAPQPPDFPISREEPGHLKSLWCRLG